MKINYSSNIEISLNASQKKKKLLIGLPDDSVSVLSPGYLPKRQKSTCHRDNSISMFILINN